MKKPIKFILLGLAALAVLGSATHFALSPTLVPLTNVKAKSVELSFTEQGLFSAGNLIKIYPMTPGRLIEVNVEEGQFVRSGDVLCLIDTEPLERRIKQTRSSIRGHEAQILALEAQDKSSNASIREQTRFVNVLVDQSQKELNKAREDLARAESLYQGNAITKVSLDDARVAVTRNEFILAASKQALAVVAAGAVGVGMADYHRAMIEAEQINIGQLENDIERCRVTAAASGIVTMLEAKGTNFVSTVTPVAEITVLDGGAVEVYVSTRDIGGVRAGDTVALTLKRRDGDIAFAGKIDSISANAEIKLSAIGLEERRVKVKISPDLSGLDDVPFGVGYDVDVRFILYSAGNKFAVPKTSLFKDNGKDMLWIVRNGRARAEEVVKGMELRTEFVIESGIAEGDAVVTDANNKDLKNGLKVADKGQL
jgi:HlyD family secretion protein